MKKTTAAKRTLTPEQLDRLASSQMRDADRRAAGVVADGHGPNVGDEDYRSFPVGWVVDSNGYSRRD